MLDKTTITQIHSFEGVDRILADPDLFRRRLGAEGASPAAAKENFVDDIWHVGAASTVGGSIASSSLVASTFFGSSGLMALLPWAPAAVTPVGWVAAAAVVTGASFYGVTRLFRSWDTNRSGATPSFVGSELDLLAMSLLDVIGALAVRVAAAAGPLDAAERAHLRGHFVACWGFDPAYVDCALEVIETNSAAQPVEGMAASMSAFAAAVPDCDRVVLNSVLFDLLEAIAAADGTVDPREVAEIATIREAFARRADWEAKDREIQRGFLGRMTDRAAGLFGRKPPQPTVLDPTLHVPTLWLLGKTGAGKSSLVQAITRSSAAAIGNGFVSCTRTAESYDFPSADPMMRFLDTRGLGEVGYDAADDIAACTQGSHLLVLVARIDDPVQGQVVDVLSRIHKQRKEMPAILVLTGADLVPDDATLRRARAQIEQVYETAWGRPLKSVCLSLGDPLAADLNGLHALLAESLPTVAMYLSRQPGTDPEAREFDRHMALVLSYAATAGASDILPVVGLASVPAVQVAMLSALARRYEVAWDREIMMKFIGSFGLGSITRYAVSTVGRQALKVVPFAGSAVAATYSLAATYALGRAAAYWMYQTRSGAQVDDADLRARYAAAFERVPDDHK
ncbi:YcjF family protein [Thioclava sediminum]|uniref:YcjF family protein n=1 Tax=Thioclava sediminum TaxID=1915319 RepID=UPI0011BADDEE|nr:TerB family tellurite resistance protein [Thioclava sediminum]